MEDKLFEELYASYKGMLHYKMKIGINAYCSTVNI